MIRSLVAIAHQTRPRRPKLNLEPFLANFCQQHTRGTKTVRTRTTRLRTNQDPDYDDTHTMLHLTKKRETTSSMAQPTDVQLHNNARYTFILEASDKLTDFGAEPATKISGPLTWAPVLFEGLLHKLPVESRNGLRNSRHLSPRPCPARKGPLHCFPRLIF